MPQRTKKIAVYIASEESGLVFIYTDFGHVSGNNVDSDFRVVSRRKRLDKPVLSDDIV